MNTNTNNNDNKTKTSRWDEIENNFVSFVVGSVKLLLRSVGIIVLTAVGSYLGVCYFHTEREMFDSEYYPLTSSQASRASQLVRLASDCMRQIEAERYNEATQHGLDLEAARDAAAEALQELQDKPATELRDKKLLMFVSALPEEEDEDKESAPEEGAEQNHSTVDETVEANK